MSLRDDDRGASVQIGAIILFGFLILAIAGWQAAVVPQDNAEVEYTHSQRVTDDMQDVRNEIVSAPGTTAMRSVSVEMAPEYPPRTLFVNPGSPSGTLRTVGTANASLNVSVNNATTEDEEVADFWNGTPHWRYETGGMAYEPGYNVYTSAPDTVYENSVLYNVEDEGTIVNVTGQDVVDGRTITLVVLNGSLSRTTSDTYTVDFEALSTSSRTVALTNTTGDTITVSFPSRRPAGWWNGTLDEARELDEYDGGHVVDVRSTSLGEFHNVTIELEGDVTYQLRMAKVGVGSGATGTEKTYAVDVEGDDSTVQSGNTRQLVVEVRDAYNNPVSGVEVRNNTTGTDLLGGSLDAEEKTTGSDGRVTFEYTAPSGTTGTANIQFNISDDVTPLDRELVTFTVDVTSSGGGGGGGGGGAYSIAWQDPDTDNPSGPLSSCTATDCTWDVGADADDQLDLRAVTDPTVENLGVEFNVNNSTVGTLSGSDADTGANGEATTTLNANENGTVKVFVTGGSASDVINVTVENVSGGGGGGGDTGPPTVTNASITNSPISDSETGTGQSVTVNFNESMDTGTNPTVEITNLTSSPYSVSGSWSDNTTWTGSVTIDDDNETATAIIEVSDAQDEAGNTMEPNPDTSNTFQVDTENPQDPIGTNLQPDPVNASTETSVSVDVNFSTTPESGTVTVRITGPNGSTVTASTAADTASTTTTVSGIDVSSLDDGTLTVEAKIVDDVGNENPSGFTASSTATKDTTPPAKNFLQADAVGTGNNIDAIDFTYNFSDNVALDRANFSAYAGGSLLNSTVDSTLTSGTQETRRLDIPRENRDVTVEVRVVDTAGNDVYYCGTLTSGSDTITNGSWTEQSTPC